LPLRSRTRTERDLPILIWWSLGVAKALGCASVPE
jgi:hypothetical protein